MAHVREVPRKVSAKYLRGIAYETSWREGDKKMQRTFTVKRDAERFALKDENEIVEGHSTDAMVKNSRTVRDVVAASLLASAPGLKLRTHLGYRAIYDNRILPEFGARRASTITRAEVRPWVVRLAASGLAPATVHHHYVALKKAFRHAIHDRLLTHNPCDGIKLPKPETIADFAPAFITVAQVETIAERLETQKPYDLLVRFSAYTGLRAGELAGLRVRDVDLTHGHINVRQTMQRVQGRWVVGTPKSKRSTRDVPLVDSALIADLRIYKMSHPRSGDPEALFWPGRRVGGVAEVDYDRVLDVSSFRRNYFRPALRALGWGQSRRLLSASHGLVAMGASACRSGFTHLATTAIVDSASLTNKYIARLLAGGMRANPNLL